MDEEERAYVMASTPASAQEGRGGCGDANIRTQAVMDAIAAGSLPPSALAEHLARSAADQKASGQIDHRSQQTLNDEEDESFVGDDGYGREYNVSHANPLYRSRLMTTVRFISLYIHFGDDVCRYASHGLVQFSFDFVPQFDRRLGMILPPAPGEKSVSAARAQRCGFASSVPGSHMLFTSVTLRW